jgi:hypothetical protein
MKNIKKYYIRVFLAFISVLITAHLVSCSFCGTSERSICYLAADIPVKELTDSGQNTVFEEPGTIVAYHGFGCAESNKSGTEDVIKVEGSQDLPPYATGATVFLNGWRLRYLNKDHHVAGLGTLISHIRLEGRSLRWQAGGVLSDKNFDDGYNWCYYYTVIAWNSANINLTVDHGDGCDLVDQTEANFFSTDNSGDPAHYIQGPTTALSSFPTFLKNPDFASSKTIAILPRGFGFDWDNCHDHHLLQTAYNLDHSEAFIENTKKYKKGAYNEMTPLPVPTPAPETSVGQVDSGYASWETYAIYKDDDGRRDYQFGEMVSGMAGSDVGVIQPPFSVLPYEDGDSTFGEPCVSEKQGVETEEFVVEHVPYEHAIPMLTGWELNYPSCGDQHVTEVGVWIDEIQYDKAPGALTGTLHYKLSSVLRDKNGDPGYWFSNNVNILGLKPAEGASLGASDLVPFSPSGTEPSAFCRIEQGGKLLRVSVKNQGSADAGASKTTVIFVNNPITLDTPAIPVGGSVDLLFQVPSGCFSPDCSFKITVDSNNKLEELNEANNSANGGCIG